MRASINGRVLRTLSDPFTKFHQHCLEVISALQAMNPDPGSPESDYLRAMEAAEAEYRTSRFKFADSVSKAKL